MIQHTRLAEFISLFVFALVFGWGPAWAGEESFALKNFAAAKVVIGQPDFTSGECDQGGNPSDKTLCSPIGGGAGQKPFYVLDTFENRVLGFGKIPNKNGASAKFVLGQPDFTSSSDGTSSTSFSLPFRVFVAHKHLFVLDSLNSRVLIWNKLPSKTNTPADVVVGQPGFTSRIESLSQFGLGRPGIGLFVTKGKLLVSDSSANRVLIWNRIPTTNGTKADLVLGQPDFRSGNPGTSQNSFRGPEGIWSNGKRLVVADDANNRVLIWNTFPSFNNALPDVVVGQSDFNSDAAAEPPNVRSLNSPSDVASDGKRLFVSDDANNRVLVYDPFPTSSNPAASLVLGASDFVHMGSGAATAHTFGEPFGLELLGGGRLLVDDFDNSRYLIFSIK